MVMEKNIINIKEKKRLRDHGMVVMMMVMIAKLISLTRYQALCMNYFI